MLTPKRDKSARYGGTDTWELVYFCNYFRVCAERLVSLPRHPHPLTVSEIGSSQSKRVARLPPNYFLSRPLQSQKARDGFNKLVEERPPRSERGDEFF